MSQVRIKAPEKAKAGDVITVRVLVTHQMEPMRVESGKIVEKNYDFIHKVEATYNGKLVFEAETSQAVSQNPFFSFAVKVMEPGKIKVMFHDTEGKTYTGEAEVKF